MTKKDHYFVILQEEAGEVIKESAKCLRFGEAGHFPIDSPSNIAKLTAEINDLIASIELLQEEGVVFENLFSREAIEKKKTKVKQMLIHSREQNRLESTTPS